LRCRRGPTVPPPGACGVPAARGPAGPPPSPSPARPARRARRRRHAPRSAGPSNSIGAASRAKSSRKVSVITAPSSHHP
jgi:hypothetical protein